MEYILIGKIHNTFGIRGELKVELYTDFADERFAKGSAVYIGEKHIEEKVKKHHFHNDIFLLTLDGKEDINMVEKYKGLNIYKSSDDIPPLANGQYYFRDLKGLNVIVDGEIKGIVSDVEEGLRNNFIRVKNGDKETLVPFLPVFIRNVDLEKKEIEVVSMEGLL